MERIDKVKGIFEKKAESAEKPTVSVAVIKRLPRYHRYLGELIKEGRLRISSRELSDIMGVTASQIRQDFNCFGGFGQQGYGYNVKYLHTKIGELLGMAEGYKAVIVGLGNLGKALASTHMFERRGVDVVALFDVNPALVGTSYNGLPVLHSDSLYDYCVNNNIHIGVLTVPKECAESVAKTLSDAGAKGIWNFANMELEESLGGAIVQNIHLGDSLMTLCFGIKSGKEKGIFDDQI